MAVTSSALRLQAQLDAQVQQVTDAQTRTLTAAWVFAWAEVSRDLQTTLDELLTEQATNGVVSRATMARSLRLRQSLGQIADRLTNLAGQARVRITSDLRAVVTDAAQAQARILSSQLPTLVDPHTTALVNATVDDAALDAIVARSTEQITSLSRPLSDDALQVVRRELVRGVAVGANPRVTARRMVRRAESGFNGGLTRALVISRTETLDAHRAAAAVQQDRNTDVLTGWIWLCHFGPGTCPSCLAQNGSVHPLSEPGPLDHQQGRCSRMPKVKTWADLGYAIEEPDDQVPDARSWFDAQPESVQLRIMGRERLELLQSGEISWDDLSSERPPGGWRSSYGVTPLKHLRRRAGAA